MQNYPPSSDSSNFLNQNLDAVKSVNQLAKRRYSLQNPMQPMPIAPMFSKLTNADMFMDQTNLHAVRKLSGCAPPPTPPMPSSSLSSIETSMFPSPPPQLGLPSLPAGFDVNSTYSQFLLNQHQQQQSYLQQMQMKQRQAAQNQENFHKFVRLCNFSGIDLNNDLDNNENSFFSSAFSNGKVNFDFKFI